MDRDDLLAIMTLIVGAWVTIAVSVLSYLEWSFVLRISITIVVSVILAMLIILCNFVIFPAPSLNVEPLPWVEGPKLKRSQFIGMSWIVPGGPNYELHADFGVLRVTAKAGDFIGCKAKARISRKIQTQGQDGKSAEVDYVQDVGTLNWYSQPITGNLSGLAEFSVPRLGAYLKNESEDIFEGESADLLLCYTIPLYRAGTERQVIAITYLCSDVAHPEIGMITNHVTGPDFEGTLNFRMEVTLTAQDRKKVRYVYDVAASRDSVTAKQSGKEGDRLPPGIESLRTP